MASLFPTTLDNFTNNVDNVDTIIAQDINDLNDAVENLQTKVGVDNSAVSTSIDYILKNKIWPIGSIYINAGVSTNPSALLGFGTWTAFGAGKMIIGIDGTDADFDLLTDTGGAKTATLATTNLPNHVHTGTTSGISANHTHAYSGTTSGQSATHHHNSNYSGGGTDIYLTSTGNFGDTITNTCPTGDASGDHTHTHSGNTGNVSADHTHTISTSATTGANATAFSILNPYVTAYMWKRTA